MKKIVIYYFTGTGNSAFIAEQVYENFKKNEYEVFLASAADFKIHPEHKNAEFIGFVSPVYGFGLSDIMARFMLKLPHSRRQKAFVFISAGNSEKVNLLNKEIKIPPHEGIAIVQSLLSLNLKGYNTVKAHMLEMPTNWTLACDPPEERYEEIFTNVQNEIAQYTQEIIQGKKSIELPNILLGLIFTPIYLGFSLIGRHILGKCYLTNKKCDSCKLCYEHCPAKTIKWKNNKPYWGWNCQACCRCINICPKNAIEVPTLSFITAMALSLFGDQFSFFIPKTVMASFGFLQIPVKILIYFAAVFFILWAIHWFERNKFTGKLFPAWYITKNRKRYKKMINKT